MATKSFLKNIAIRNASECKALILAMEKSASAKHKEVKYSKGVSTMDADEIKMIFGGVQTCQESQDSNKQI